MGLVREGEGQVTCRTGLVRESEVGITWRMCLVREGEVENGLGEGR